MDTEAAIVVIGAGLAGSEAAWQIANQGIPVILYEMKPSKLSPAHVSKDFAELVCSNSLRSDDHTNSAVGLLHYEMRMMNSLIMQAADATKVPAGSALAVAREDFSSYITKKLHEHENIYVQVEEVVNIPKRRNIISIKDSTNSNNTVKIFHVEHCVIATGPLTSDDLYSDIAKLTGEEYLAFFDAIAPIIYKDSIDFNIAWMQSRYDKGEGQDYINCPLNKEQYENFIAELVSADSGEFKEWEKNTPYFNGCLPIEVMAKSGTDTLRYGPMKPVGLTNPYKDERPYAVVQLRQDNALGTLYNMVGFQTKIKWGEQKRILQMIPGLENAEFARLGGIHRNSFIKSPILLDRTLRLKASPYIRFAGQITGVEGYVESSACGLMAGLFVAHDYYQQHVNSSKLIDKDNSQNSQFNMNINTPNTTAIGALLRHITGDAEHESFQPMNINFGLFPLLDYSEFPKKPKKSERKELYCVRAKKDFANWQQNNGFFC